MDQTPTSLKYTLKYTPTKKDLSSTLPRGMGRFPQTPFLSLLIVGGRITEWDIHGNSNIVVYKEEKVVSQEKNTWRRWRIWKLSDALNPKGPPELDWSDDHLSDSPSWSDIPGIHLGDTPDRWLDERRMLEFVVSVKGHTKEVDALYYFVIVSTKSRKYRVEMSSSTSIPFEQCVEDVCVGDLLKTRNPWAKSSGCEIVLDSGWLYFA
jgi:hypothetical protein